MKKITRVILVMLSAIMLCTATMTSYAVAAASTGEETVMTASEMAKAERFNAIIRRYRESKKNWVYPAEVIDSFEKALGYKPEYRVERWGCGYYELMVEFSHLDVWWGLGITTDPEIYDGWRIERSAFEKQLDEMKGTYLETGVDICDGTYYTTEEVEDLFKEAYGYDVNVYVCTYHRRDGISADFIVCDRYNGREIEIDAILTNVGWRVPEAQWIWFTENFCFEEEKEYATAAIYWWTLDDLKEEFEYWLGYTPEIEVWQDPQLEWWKTIDVSFEHLGGKTYSIEYAFERKEGDIRATDKVVERFFEENPEMTQLLDIDNEDELERMYAFYKARLEAED